MLASFSLVKNILSAICAALHALSATAYAGEQDNANQTQEKAQEEPKHRAAVATLGHARTDERKHQTEKQ
ncbi:hypothetical protein B621_gp30 [Marinomonas phage P12026]|uniref:hypothetical protein n=1 Tax=Marinomonas phage P12026 TaxID=1176423 RepID=UPI0002688F48|nr:hypothetical protein B621_gp30 [Marinomonas phage P12026]AFM54876.1 hypothetical protein P12026_30 [Marinomonas phage P12026]